MEQENPKKILVFKIIAFEAGSTNLIFSNRIVVIGSQYVTKEPEYLRYH